MKSKLSDSEKKTIRSDFTQVLALSLISQARGLSQEERQDVKDCLREKRYTRALRIIGKRYSSREWQSFVETHANSLLKSYM